MTITDIPPHDIEAEEALIGCCIQSADALNRIIGKVSEAAFYLEMNRTVYKHIVSIFKEGHIVNSENVIIGLAEKKVSVSVEYLTRCMNAAPIPKNAEYFADIILSKYKARELIVASENIQALAKGINTGNALEILVESETMISDVVRGYNSGIDYYNEEKYKADRVSMIDGIKWGYPALDDWCNIPVGRAAYIGSVSNGGKSAFMFNVAQSLSKRGERVAIFTYEDSRFDSTLRMNYIFYCDYKKEQITDLFPKDIALPDMTFWEYRNKVKKNENRFREIDDVCRMFSHERILFFDKNLMVDEIETYVKNILNEHKELDVIFLDYLQIIPTDDKDGGYMKLKGLVNGLNEIARRYRVSVVSACQMTVSESDTEKKDYMKISRVREARDIFHSCALFLGMHNETQFNAQQNGGETSDANDKGCFDILKNKTLEGIEIKNVPFTLERSKLKFDIKRRA